MAARFDLIIDEGATFTFAFAWATDLGPPAVYKNLTGYTAKLQIRAEKDEASPVLSTRQTSDASIVLGGVAGTVTARWTPAETVALRAALDETPDAFYDLLLTAPDTVVTRLLEGGVHLKERVTV